MLVFCFPIPAVYLCRFSKCGNTHSLPNITALKTYFVQSQYFYNLCLWNQLDVWKCSLLEVVPFEICVETWKRFCSELHALCFELAQFFYSSSKGPFYFCWWRNWLFAQLHPPLEDFHVLWLFNPSFYVEVLDKSAKCWACKCPLVLFLAEVVLNSSILLKAMEMCSINFVHPVERSTESLLRLQWRRMLHCTHLVRTQRWSIITIKLFAVTSAAPQLLTDFITVTYMQNGHCKYYVCRRF